MSEQMSGDPILSRADRLIDKFERQQAAHAKQIAEIDAGLNARGIRVSPRQEQAQRAGEQFWQSVANQARSDQGRVEAQAEKAGERPGAKATQGADAQPRRGARVRL